MTTTRKLCYPHPRGSASHVPGGENDLHQTAGLPGNWALDFLAPGGTPVLAVEDGRITRFSGHDPADGVRDGDIFGWNVYVEAPDKVEYFYTHLGTRTMHVGDKVKRGKVIGAVGHWPDDPGRSHTHLGCTHPMGEKASKRAICNVLEAPKVNALK